MAQGQIQFMQLPALQANRLLSFAPIMEGMDSLDNKLRYREQFDYRKQQDAAQEARARASHGAAMQDREEARRLKFIQGAAGVAQLIDAEQDPVKKQTMWGKFIGSDPRFAAGFKQYGLDPNDYSMGPKFLLAQARGYQDPQSAPKPDVKEVGGRLVRISPDGSQATEIYAPSGSGLGDLGPYKDMKQKAEVEEGLRKEVYNTNKDYSVIRDAEAKITALAKDPSAGSDIALIYSFMKALDPGSVVRETEYATAQNAAGVPDQVRNVWNRILAGERLNPAQRADFVKQAQTVATAQRQQYERSINQYRGVAERLRVDPRNVILDGGSDGQAAPAQRQTQIPPNAVRFLMQNANDPMIIEQFEQKYGAGSARQFLQGR